MAGFWEGALRGPKGFAIGAKASGFCDGCDGAPNGLALEVAAPKGDGWRWIPLALLEGCEDDPNGVVVPWLGPKGLTAGPKGLAAGRREDC